MVYFLFLDDNDVFAIYKKNRILKENNHKIGFEKGELERIKFELAQVNSLDELERIAREEKLFKKDNEEVFVIVRE